MTEAEIDEGSSITECVTSPEKEFEEKKDVGEVIRLSHKALGIDVELQSSVFSVDHLAVLGLDLFEKLSNRKKKEVGYV